MDEILRALPDPTAGNPPAPNGIGEERLATAATELRSHMSFELVPIDGQVKLTAVRGAFRPDSESLMTVSQASRGSFPAEHPRRSGRAGPARSRVRTAAHAPT